MPDFAQFSPNQIVEYIDSNFGLFSSERDNDFPSNVLEGIERDIFSVVCESEGFAVAYNGRCYTSGTGHVEADLMFLYVAPEFEGQGIGTRLVESVKSAVTPGVPIILQCEGTDRMEFFKRRGFVVTKCCQEIDTYYMRWESSTLN